MTLRFVPLTEAEAEAPLPWPPSDPPAPARKFILEHISSIRFEPRACPDAVKGLLPAEGLATIYGAPKNYKSFVAMDAALAIARNQPWAGRRVASGAVVYVACEGALGARMRLCAYLRRHQLSAPDFPFYFVDARPNLGIAGGDTPELVSAIDAVCASNGIAPRLVVIDTLARSLAGANENAEGMVAFVANAEDVSRHFGCLTVAVHHTPHGGDRMRGHSSLLGSVVASWRVEKVEKLCARVTLEDAKDLESGISWEVALEVQEIGFDAEGDEISSLVVSTISDPMDGLPPSARKSERSPPPPSSRAFMRAFEEALSEFGRKVRPFQDGPEVQAVSIEDVRGVYYRMRGDEESQDAKRKAFSRSRSSMVERGELCAAKMRDMGAILWRP